MSGLTGAGGHGNLCIFDLMPSTTKDWGASPPTAPPLYQWAAYRLDVDGLAIKWGSFALTAAAAVQPILGPSDPCDDSVVLCYEHGD